MTSLIFVHGTGGREAAYAATFGLLLTTAARPLGGDYAAIARAIVAASYSQTL